MKSFNNNDNCRPEGLRDEKANEKMIGRRGRGGLFQENSFEGKEGHRDRILEQNKENLQRKEENFMMRGRWKRISEHLNRDIEMMRKC